MLAIRSPESLYPNDATESKHVFRKLSMEWHPDRGGDDTVFKHIKALYEEVEVKIRLGTWELDGVRTIETDCGKKFRMRYLAKRRIEVGEMFVCRHSIIYIIDIGASDLVGLSQKAYDRVDRVRDAALSKYVPLMPREVGHYRLMDGRTVVMYSKPEGMILLRDALEHLGGAIHPRHVAWITSRMYSVASFLDHIGWVHGDLSPDTIFIDPREHTIGLLGGWWYGTKAGEKLTALPKRTVNHVPKSLITKKVADPTIDSYLIRVTARELLGDIHGSKLLVDKSIPDSMKAWVRGSGTDDVLSEFKDWYDKCLIESFGKRKFVELRLSAGEVYSRKFA